MPHTSARTILYHARALGILPENQRRHERQEKSWN
jgi:hypothetical protein